MSFPLELYRFSELKGKVTMLFTTQALPKSLQVGEVVRVRQV